MNAAHRPAPVQVSYLGYPYRTGLPAIDHRLTDAIADPPGGAGPGAEEDLVRLACGFGGFAPRLDAPPVAPAPCGGGGPLTVGSTHKPLKLNDRVLDVWAAVLRAVPDSRLLLFRVDPPPVASAVAPGRRFRQNRARQANFPWKRRGHCV
jgi:predicted O-linked N-acetylglucosamine transferase (SPINDLY family)